MLGRKSKELQLTLAAERVAVAHRTKAERAAVLATGLRQAQRQFVDFVSHKLRNPMHILQNSVDIICSAHCGEDFDEVARATAEVARLTRELVLHHELAAGDQETHIRSVNVRDWLHDLQVWLHSHLHIDGNLVVDASVPDRVPLDPLWTREALVCLLRLEDIEEKGETTSRRRSESHGGSHGGTTLHISTAFAPQVSNTELLRHANIITSAEWLQHCADVSRVLHATPYPPNLPHSNLQQPLVTEYVYPSSPVADNAGRLSWFLQIEALIKGLSAVNALREFAKPTWEKDQHTPLEEGASDQDDLQSSLANNSVKKNEKAAPPTNTDFKQPDAAASIFETSVRMDLRLAKLVAGVLRGRIGIIDGELGLPGQNTPKANEKRGEVVTRLILQLPLPWAICVPPGVNVHFPPPLSEHSAGSVLSSTDQVLSASHHAVSPPGAQPPQSFLGKRKLAVQASSFLSPSMNEGHWPLQRHCKCGGVESLSKSAVTSPLEATPGINPADSDVPSASAAEPARVLVVDDDATIRKLHLRLLQRLNLACHAVEDGDQVLAAVEAAAAEGRPFAVIMMDLVMKRVHGDQACALLRENGCNIVVLAVTANANQADYPNLMRAGFADVLCKPFSLAQLQVTLSSCGVVCSYPVSAGHGISLTPEQPSNLAEDSSSLSGSRTQFRIQRLQYVAHA
jgi:CheY-like chemotaxis protein